jgi:hypothetical protein
VLRALDDLQHRRMLLVDVRARHSLRFGSLCVALFHRSPLQAPFVQSRLLGVAIRTDTLALQQLALPQMRTQPIVVAHQSAGRKTPSFGRLGAPPWPRAPSPLRRITTLCSTDAVQQRCTEARRLRRSTLCRLCHCCRPRRRTMLSNSPGVRGR